MRQLYNIIQRVALTVVVVIAVVVAVVVVVVVVVFNDWWWRKMGKRMYEFLEINNSSNSALYVVQCTTYSVRYAQCRV